MTHDLDDLRRRLALLEAREQIRDLASRYSQGADHHDEGLWLSVWAADAVWDVGGGRRFTGREQILGAVRTQWARIPRMLHATSNHRIDVAADNDVATGVADVVVLGEVSGPPGDGGGPAGAPRTVMLGAGVYRDRYHREAGVWLIAERRATDDFWVLEPPGA